MSQRYGFVHFEWDSFHFFVFPSNNAGFVIGQIIHLLPYPAPYVDLSQLQ